MTSSTTTTKLAAALCAASMLCLAPPASAEERAPLPGAPVPMALAEPIATPMAWPIRFSGEFWVDTGYLNRENTQSGEPNQTNNYMAGRFVLGGTYARSVNELTALAKVELLGLTSDYADGKYGGPHVQDAYVQLGNALWDVQLGRFLAQEVYYRGQGIERYTAEEAGALGGPEMYRVQFNRGHQNGPGQAAVHYRPMDFLSLELAGTYGFVQEQNNLGIRPVADVHLGGLQLVAGWEYLEQTPVKTGNLAKTKMQGYGARLQYRMPILTAGVDFAQASQDKTDLSGLVDAGNTWDKTSLGGWVDADLWQGSLGLGYHFTTRDDDKGANDEHHQFFVSYLHHLPIDGLSIKAVYGYALARIEDVDANTEYDNALNSFRIRVKYEFR